MRVVNLFVNHIFSSYTNFVSQKESNKVKSEVSSLRAKHSVKEAYELKA
jgi:hypothetical protein